MLSSKNNFHSVVFLKTSKIANKYLDLRFAVVHLILLLV